MVIAFCSRCHKPCPDSFHDFPEVCECIDWEKRAKKMGWELKFPDNYKKGDKE